jgi:hypothetical protein
MKIRITVLVEVAVALTMLSRTTPPPETTQQQRAEWEAGRAWAKEHMKSSPMSRL